jgi:hypothetical protein
MPVNFQTDLRDLKNFDYVPQIPLEALFKNMSYKQAKYDQGFQQAQSIREGLNVKAYGQDAVRRDELLKQIDEESKKFAGADFSDKNVLAQYTNWLNSIASSPEFAGFKQRADARDKAQSQYDKLTADGKTVISPYNNPLLKMDNYFNGNEEYNPNKRFGDSNVYIDFNFADLDKDVVNNTKEIEQMRNAPGGQLESYKGLATSALYANLNNAYLNNPGARRELLAQYQSKHTPAEFTQMSMEEALQKANTALQSASTFRALASKEIDPTRKNELLAQASDADNNAKFWSNFNAMDNPDLAYQYGFEDWIRSKALQRAEANTTFALRDRKTSDIYLQENKAKLDLRNALIQTEKEKVLGSALDRGLVSIDASGNITGYTSGVIPEKTATGGPGVSVGGVNYDYATYNWYVDTNNPVFLSTLAQDKDKFKISRDGYSSVRIKTVSQNKDGTYTLTGRFYGPTMEDGEPILDDNGNPVLGTIDHSIIVTNDEISDAYLAGHPNMLRKMPAPTNVIGATGATEPSGGFNTTKKVTPQQNILDANGNIVIKANTPIPSYANVDSAKADPAVKIGTYFYDESEPPERAYKLRK